jgi:lipoprotein-releasing system ATP-binding protein
MTPMSDNNDSAPIILAENIRKEYPTPAAPLVVLDDVSLRVARGESLAVMGPSGSGKSTLLYILGTLETITSGRVLLYGRNPFELAAGAMSDFRNREIGFVFQDHHLLPQCTALENVMAPTLAHAGTNRKDAQMRATALLDTMGLRDRAEHFPSDLSGGERQRVAVARAMVNRPGIILCDEPTGNLDEASGEMIGDCLERLQRDAGVALVVVTHNPRFARRFDRVVELKGGKFEA